MANPANHPSTISWLIGLKENVFKSEAECDEIQKWGNEFRKIAVPPVG